MVKPNIQSRKPRNLKSLLKKMEKAGESLNGVKLNKDSKIASAELKMLGISAVIKKEGLSNA